MTMTLDWQNTATWQVLVVDDEEDNLEIVAETLHFYGVFAKKAQNGLEALDVLREYTPNLILLDLSMAKMDGWEARTRIKAEAKTPIVIIALTAHAMQGDAERVYAAGFDGYLSKPINVGTLINDIRVSVARRPKSSASQASLNP